MNFQPLTLAEIPLVRPYFNGLRSRTCDFSVGGMFMWRDFFSMQYAIEDGVFYSKLHNQAGECFYNLPLGGDMAQAIGRIVAHADKAGHPARFCTVPEEYVPLFSQGGREAVLNQQEIYTDYLYLAQDLAQMKGKKFSGQRNQISQFLRGTESWSFGPITPENLPEVTAFFVRKVAASVAEMPSETEEALKVTEVLQNYSLYGMTGGVLYADGRVAGFSMGEIIGDTLYNHVEKADREITGAYQMLVRQFADSFSGSGVTYINREEDMGDPGLRTSKLAYHPCALLKKFVVEVR